VKVLGVMQHLEYKIFEHPDLAGKLCLARCHRYKNIPSNVQALGPNLPWCPCDKLDGNRPPAKARGEASGSSGLQGFMAALAQRKADKAMVVCPHYLAGKCHQVGRGLPCAFAHHGGSLTMKTSDIQCKLDGKCTKKCGYAHSHMDEDLCKCPSNAPPWEPD
jgi:hypothetical protein